MNKTTSLKAKEIKEKGLTFTEAEKLRKKYGKNEIKEKTQKSFIRFLKKFLDPIQLMIEVALLFSALVGKWEDFVVILILLAINVTVDFAQEQKAKNALKELEHTLAVEAVALRNGKFLSINAKELVPGDIIKLRIGDVIPADAVFIDGGYLFVDQSTITGESLPVEKKIGDILYSSSTVQKGSTIARVTAIGKNTFIGESARLVQKAETEEESHFQKAILNIGRFLIFLSSVLISVVFVALMSRGDSLVETIRFCLTLSVASIPVALPTVLSVTMAIGASKLARERAVVSNFRAIEELAGVDELCVDKTGTLTKNEIEVISPKVYLDYKLSDLFTYALLASSPNHRTSIEDAVYNFAKKNNFIRNVSFYKIKKFIPFDFTKKSTEVLATSKQGSVNIIMGATQVIEQSINDKKLIDKFLKDVNFFTKKGLRTIAIAKKEGRFFVPVGIIPLIDPPRDDSKSVISNIKKRGISVRMITGDNKLVALFMAAKLGLGKKILTNSFFDNLRKNGITKKDISEIVRTNIFAEVVPRDKYDVVEILQNKGHIVAMTGDGVNDAPALKKADIGIAVSGASPATRSAADLVLLDSGLSVIKNAITHSRMTFSRMQSYATFRISETIRIIFFITLSILIFNQSPLSVIMVILLALLNDIPVMAIAYDNVSAHKKPIRWHLRETLFISVLLGLAGLVSSFLLFYWLNINNFSIAIIQTIMFLKLDVAGHSTLYLTRTEKKHFWEKPFPSLKFFLPAFSSRILGTLIAVYGIFIEPIGWKVAGLIWLYALAWFLVNDWVKVFAYKLLSFLEKKNFLVKKSRFFHKKVSV